MDRCLVCNQDLHVPNQRLVNRKNEVFALKNRYKEAVNDAKQRGVGKEVAEFEQVVKKQSEAIINCTEKFLYGFLSDNNQLYANYRQQTSSATRKVAELNNDRQRCGAEGVLFGSMAEHIIYAILSINGQGLLSYGRCAMALREITMQNKATVLEKNSYDFVKEHKIVPGESLPVGYWSHWKNRHLLVVAKLATKIKHHKQNFMDLLFTTNGNREQDDFVEVHIYGSLDKQAISNLTLPRSEKKNIVSHALLRGIDDYAEKLNITCSYYD